jgi:hypothetical protein
MATSITVICRFKDGGFGYLQNADVTSGSAGEEIQTSNATNLLNQTGSVSAGQAYEGRVMTHAVAIVSTQNGYSGAYLWAAIKDSQGSIVCPIQGGGGLTGELPALYKPIALSTGYTVDAAWQAAADSATLIASLIVCSPRKCDVFFGTGVDATAVELTNAAGSTVGQSMSGQTANAMWAVYPSTIGMNNQGAGVSAVWVTDAQGQLVALIPPWSGGGGGTSGLDSVIPSPVTTPVSFGQNFSAYCATDT